MSLATFLVATLHPYHVLALGAAFGFVAGLCAGAFLAARFERVYRKREAEA